MENLALIINSLDNVATAMRDLPAGITVILVNNGRHREVLLKDNIPYGHKFTIVQIIKGNDVIKYGESIGRAVADIGCGELVHVHNLESKRG